MSTRGCIRLVYYSPVIALCFMGSSCTEPEILALISILRLSPLIPTKKSVTSADNCSIHFYMCVRVSLRINMSYKLLPLFMKLSTSKQPVTSL
jgi:hypothetical protein